MQEKPYNPLEKRNLAISVSDALLERPISKLPPPEPFEGAGIYAIYYTGDFSLYQKIAERNRNGRFEAPIYVGKAVPPGARKGGFGLDIPPGQVLYRRLCEHAESIKQARNLDIEGFYCRYLVVDDIWIPLGESLLIQRFSPVWNQVLDGFGNHDPGSGRYSQQRSRWDTVHPGRVWADRLTPNAESLEKIVQAVEEFLRNWQPDTRR
ncbi:MULTISPECIES: Eco29kI family restriction endonuclease [Alicyclobacillus]|uniref:Restriction endonuclease, type II, Eco29kI n=1 Tax=Alicyclobacillus acidocaldarius subsp. acidocaldarius (strain ATCC 27009 / DSM 446 / BCRC 14685 / JCM 5260 / KCTC 1825 / NBRC 15652 / NCIMB 11725 / NRRL B-14509 / 104-IA) TaxID=521098 RepID=C8WVP4_ALIAD|nr:MULTISPECIES: Eco29kI family restriction endonuclease [Alicyclobacillus]ACV58166.1 Restriction endonuclease, type II, Eco29kI [Alicyclobacillus acidocaldarius subsp. acidocaldarius DSM 446]